MNRLTCSPRPDKTTTILIGAGLQREVTEAIRSMGDQRQVCALVDETIARSYPDWIPADWQRIELAGGEGCKTFEALERVLRQMIEWRLDRRTVLVAMGGGTIGDLGGLVASLFLRGIDLIQVPTTLLAMLDSSVGGKTAINVPEGKNLVGTFWPPQFMVADVELLASLPEAELLSGLGEALKMGIGFSRELFELLEQDRDAIRGGDPTLLARVVSMAVEHKITTVEADPFETTGRRRCLNLGHTLGHALESLSNYSMLHGHAVAQGLHFALDVAARDQHLTKDDADRCHALVESYGFSQEPIPPAAELLPYFERDKKIQDGELHFVVPTGIGSCQTVPYRPLQLAR